MNGSDSDPRDRYLSANNWRDNYVEVSRDSLAWLGRTRTDAENVLRLRRVKEENPEVLAAVWDAALNDTSRKVLMAVSMNGGGTYADLKEWVPRAGHRTLERKVADLRDGGVIASEGRPAVHHFATPAAELLTEDVLAIVD